MANDEHLWNPDLQADHKKVPNSTENGQCVVRHRYEYNKVSKRVGGVSYLKQHSCNHRWQAFKRALNPDSGDYDGNWYLPFINRQAPKFERVVLLYINGRMVQRKVHSKKPKAGDWDITATGVNYRTTCNRPYWHESHHIIPNGALRQAISDVGKNHPLAMEIRAKIISGLLQAQYNLNHKDNMIILPIEKQISEAIRLPIHVDRINSSTERHGHYSDNVRLRLDEIFQAIQGDVDPAQHQAPKLVDTKQQLVDLSETLRGEIKKAAPGASLDEHFKP